MFKLTKLVVSTVAVLGISGGVTTIIPDITASASITSTVQESDSKDLSFFRGTNANSLTTKRIHISRGKAHLIVRNSGIGQDTKVTVKLFKSGKEYKSITHMSKTWNQSGGFHTYSVANGDYSARIYSAGTHHKVFGGISNSNFY